MIRITPEEFPEVVDCLEWYCNPWDYDPDFPDYKKGLTPKQRDWLVNLFEEWLNNTPDEDEELLVTIACREQLERIKKL